MTRQYVQTKTPRDFIARIDKDTGEILELYQNFLTLRDAGYDMGAVCNVCNGRRHVHKGYKWKYVTFLEVVNACKHLIKL